MKRVGHFQAEFSVTAVTTASTKEMWYCTLCWECRWNSKKQIHALCVRIVTQIYSRSRTSSEIYQLM